MATLNIRDVPLLRSMGYTAKIIVTLDRPRSQHKRTGCFELIYVLNGDMSHWERGYGCFKRAQESDIKSESSAMAHLAKKLSEGWICRTPPLNWL